MLKTVLLAAIIVVVLIVLGAWATKPATLEVLNDRADLGGDPATYLQKQEAAAAESFGLVEGTEKRILWAADEGARSEYVVIYLHGFSASRGEIAPVPERVAAALGANLFETRLAGHGRKRNRLAHVSAESWLDDGAEALAIGRALGDKLILIGVSTGATVALAMARHPDFSAVDSLVLVSPNWAPAAGGADIATGPYGPQIVRLVAGKTRSWEAANPLQEKFWTTSYPTSAVVELMRLVKLGDRLTTEAQVPNALLIYSPQDDVISVPKALEGFGALPADRKQVLSIDNPDSLSPHVFTGDALAPAETDNTVAAIVEFLSPRS